MALQQTRRKKRVPNNYLDRVRKTQQALRYVRVSDDDEIDLVTRSENALGEGWGPIFPSFAVLQLYLLNDITFGAEYVDAPIRFESNGIADYYESVNGVKQMVKSFETAAKKIGEIDENSGISVFRGVPWLYGLFPAIYIVLRNAVLQGAAALDPKKPITRKLEETIYESWRSDRDVVRKLARIQREDIEWRSQINQFDQVEKKRRGKKIAEQAKQIVDRFLADVSRLKEADADESQGPGRLPARPLAGTVEFSRPAPPTPVRRNRPLPDMFDFEDDDDDDATFLQRFPVVKREEDAEQPNQDATGSVESGEDDEDDLQNNDSNRPPTVIVKKENAPSDQDSSDDGQRSEPPVEPRRRRALPETLDARQLPFDFASEGSDDF